MMDISCEVRRIDVLSRKGRAGAARIGLEIATRAPLPRRRPVRVAYGVGADGTPCRAEGLPCLVRIEERPGNERIFVYALAARRSERLLS